MKPRRSGCRTSRLRRRYGCFSLPVVPGATVKESNQKKVSWLARTDPVNKTIEFSHHFDQLKPDEKKFIVLHERAHLETGPDHDSRFYGALKRLIEHNNVPWPVAFMLESYNCHMSH